MLTRTDFVNEIEKFSNLNICYNPQHKMYQLNDLWANEITTNYYDSIFEDFESSIYKNIDSIKDKSKFLIELYDLIWTKINWYNENEISHFIFFNNIKSRITKSNYFLKEPRKNKYSIEFIKNFNYDKPLDSDDIILTLKRYEKETNSYENEADFEKAILIHALQLHYDFLIEIYHFLYKLEMDFDNIDFENYSSVGSFQKKNTNSKKCSLSFDKITTSVFFKILIEAEIFYMDKDSISKNNVKMNEFIQDNFLFTNKEGETEPIRRINKEVSKFNKAQYHEKQLEILDNLISLLKENKKHICKINKIPIEKSSGNPLE